MSQISFEDLSLSPELMRAVREIGFENATEIQAQAIPLLLSGRDVTGRSRTGTGKTAAFGIPAVQLADGANKTDVQVLVLCPTRELALQSWAVFKMLYKYKTGVKAAVIYGGQPIERQIRELKKGVNIVIGTPGRLLDHLRRRTIRLNRVKMVILDEADEMLDMGFREDIEAILNATPSGRQTALFSATMPPEILAISKAYQNNPEFIEVKAPQMTLETTEQYYVEAPARKKQEALLELLRRSSPSRCIIFCNTQKMVDALCGFLTGNGYAAAGIHGRMKQVVRTQVMESFKKGGTAMLVATDVAARGIDAQDVDAVINYDVPANAEAYVHRIGRTGRAGKSGRAFTMVSGRAQIRILHDIENATKAKIAFQDIGFDRCSFRPEQENSQEKPGTDARGSGAKYRKARPQRSSLGTKRKAGGKTGKIVLNLGLEQHLVPANIVCAIAEKTGLAGSEIGKIDILPRSTVVEIPAENLQEVLNGMNGSKIRGMVVDAKPQETAGDGRGRVSRPGRRGAGK